MLRSPFFRRDIPLPATVGRTGEGLTRPPENRGCRCILFGPCLLLRTRSVVGQPLRFLRLFDACLGVNPAASIMLAGTWGVQLPRRFGQGSKKLTSDVSWPLTTGAVCAWAFTKTRASPIYHPPRHHQPERRAASQPASVVVPVTSRASGTSHVSPLAGPRPRL